MKKFLTLTLAFMLCLTTAACAAKPASTGTDRSALDFAKIIKEARDQETNDNMDIIGAIKGETPSLKHNPHEIDAESSKDMIAMSMEFMGLTPDMLDNFAFSASMMNIRAYAVGIFLPAADKAEDVKAALQTYVDNQVSSFTNYLPDQFEVAKAAVLKQLPTGEYLLVMSPDASDIATAMESALK